MDLKINEWNQSYKNKDNFVFYPHEEVIRFVSKYIRKQVGINKVENISSLNTSLDLGCGIGRHVIYLDYMGFDAYGMDLSEEAISFAAIWCKHLGKLHLMDRFCIGDISDMPYENEFFDFVISHGVLDSMPFELAKKAVIEVNRVVKKDGLFYLDLVSGDDFKHSREFRGEEIVAAKHEQGTIQSYFNWEKVKELLDGYFKIKEAILIERQSVIETSKNSRYHIIAAKI